MSGYESHVNRISPSTPGGIRVGRNSEHDVVTVEQAMPRRVWSFG
jgi:hypothetical protein